MNTPNTDFQGHWHRHELWRYPAKQQDKTLQAWDTADTYLLNYLAAHYNQQPVTIINDTFGALACQLHSWQPNCVSDSILSELATKENARRNGLESPDFVFNATLAPPSGQHLKLVIGKLPKVNALLEAQLQQIHAQANSQTQLILAGKTTQVTSSVLQLIGRYFESVTTSLAQKKSRLIFANSPQKITQYSDLNSRWQIPEYQLTLDHLPNVFSRQKLDPGARFMLAHLPQQQTGYALDLGCGNGVLGIRLAQLNPDLQIDFVDESAMAVASTQQNVTTNLPEAQRYHFVQSDCLQQWREQFPEKQLNLIINNPPFHQGNTITEHIAEQMFRESHKALARGGELWIVANRHLPYNKILKRIFGGMQIVATDRKFTIFRCLKR